MNKKQLVAEAASRADLTGNQAENAVSAIFDHIGNALARGETVSLVGFGSFSPRKRSARTGRHPQTGEAIEISESQTVHFRAGKALRQATQNGGNAD